MRMLFPHHVPSRFMNELASDVNAIFGTMLGEEASTSGFTPAMDIEETEDGYTLSLDVPGVNPEDISIELDDGHVTIHGERQQGAESDNVTWRRVERTFGQFRRKFRLPKLVDQQRIDASYENGVLTIGLPKVEKQAAKRIVVAHGGSKSVDESEDTATS